MAGELQSRRAWIFEHHDALVAAVAIAGLVTHVMMAYGLRTSEFAANVPLWAALVLGGIPVLLELAYNASQGKFGADWLAGISIITAILLGQYLAGVLVVLMLSGGEAIEAYALASASSVLSALAKRVPLVAHRRSDGQLNDIPLDQVNVGDVLTLFPHDICPVDGEVIEGHGSMDESFLTGEPYNMSKAPGSLVISGALNGNVVLIIRATKRAIDSRYAQIMKVMEQGEQYRPRMRRLGDQLGAWYTPLALVIAGIAWAISGEATRFLAVLVVATPCPLLIAIPVAIIGAISLAARHGIIVKKPTVLEQIGGCRTIIFDKTGTLTYGRPSLTEQLAPAGVQVRDMLQLAASLERYSKHPLSQAIVDQAEREGIALLDASEIQEPPGQGVRGKVHGREVQITGRNKLAVSNPTAARDLPPVDAGLECILLVDGNYAATYRFRDEPRLDGRSFIHHLGPQHHIDRVMIVSGDRESEVKYLAARVGITDVRAEQSPEQKVEIVRAETARAPTIFVGDGINDAPALQIATVGIAFGQASDITSEAAGAVIMDSSLKRVDMLLHIGHRMRSIALQSAVGGIVLSLGGMLLAASGHLSPVAGAVLQEVIDVVAVLNAARVAWSTQPLNDY
ncbi:Zinc-transporting ATPase [Anatilimnocola aggregata]|uniref:P-type Zn(2+) transporter n=1 Tax=Anatilimnocola aggregata TaxID=2528021 RepID=A0A517Y4G8_9BACT|nr:Zinc-transporting ATPase [Anatilimnocola aggregata]